LIKLSLALAGLAICNALLAVLTPWYVVTHLGVGFETDAFFASGTLPQLIFLVASLTLTQVLVPLLATQDEKTFRRDAWGFFLCLTAVVGLLAIFLGVTAGYWVALLFPGFSDQAKQLTVSLTRIQLLAMIGNASVAVLWSVYYAREKFVWAELSSVLANVLSFIFLIWALPYYGVASAAWAAVLNLVMKIALLMPFLGRWQWPQWNSYAMKEAWRRIKPFLLGQTYSKTDPLIDRFLTSMTTAGHLSLLYIGQQIYSSAIIVISKSITAPTVPRMAIAAKASDWRAFRRIYRERLLWMGILSILAAIVLIIFGESLLNRLIGHEGVTSDSVRMLWWIMLALIGLLIGGAAGQVTTVAFYAMGDTRTPTMLFIGTFTVYLPIKCLVFLRYGLLGLAITTSVHLVINFLLQLVILEKVTGRTQILRD
jgi:putative peptidoglycan lipid II flippase